MKKYDVAVIGAGSIGVRAASLAAAGGAQVVLLDSASYAKKAGYDDSLGRQFLVDAAMRPKATWATVKKTVAAEVEKTLARNTADKLRDRDVATLFGAVKLHEDLSITVGGDSVMAKKVILAMPSMPRQPVSMGLRKDMVVTPGSLVQLKSKPRSVVVVGAGISGVETAFALAGLGVAVHLVDHNSRILKQLDEEAARVIADRLTARGVTIYTSASIPKVVARRGGKTVSISRYHNLVTIRVSQVVLATGPALRPVRGLKNLVRIEEGNIEVDALWRTSNHRIYAVNDSTDRVCGYGQSSLPLVNAVMHAVKGTAAKADFDVPYVVRVSPEVASVGPVESQLTREGIEYDSLQYSYADLGIMGRGEGFIKLLVDKKRCIMATTIVGAGAGASIGYFAHMAADGDTLDDLRELLVPSDTLVGRVAQAVPARAVSVVSPVARFFMTFAKK